jgi:PHD/YefM family antitoxin component YafN of YafNO toxin-antitoxin module
MTAPKQDNVLRMPASVFRRNMNSVMRAFEKGVYEKVLITRRGKDVAYCVAPGHYDELVKASRAA